MKSIKEELNTFEIHNVNSLNEYIELVKYRKENVLIDGYKELHHILPKSIFPQYADTVDNLVYLTKDEHVLAHKLLWEMLQIYGMKVAYHMMSGKNPDNLARGENNPAKLDYVREKISKSKKGKPRKDMLGKSFFGADEETRKQISLKNSQKKRGMASVKDKFGNSFQVSVNDPRYLSGELVGVHAGVKRENSASKRPEIKAKMKANAAAFYEKFKHYTFDEMTDFLVSKSLEGKEIFGKKRAFAKNFSRCVKQTNFDEHSLKTAVVQRLEKSNK